MAAMSQLPSVTGPLTIKLTGTRIVAIFADHVERLNADAAREQKMEEAAADTGGGRRRMLGSRHLRDRAARIVAFTATIEPSQTYELSLEDVCRLGLFRDPCDVLHDSIANPLF